MQGQVEPSAVQLAAAGKSLAAALQRAFDLVFSATVLLVAAPLLLVAAVAIKLESRSTVLFRQVRLGRDGRPFELLKLRGMHPDAEERWPELYDYGRMRPDEHFHHAEDPRVLRVARLTRRFSIDELPNFVNVLKGDKSVVGPRPEIPAMTHLYGEALDQVLSVRPGVTSPAKASGRDDLTFAETLAADLAYIRNRSFLLDLVTIARTAVNSVRGHGVR
jgi:lipopolysaccharide/colanic/teichoic acid biosynthesis glycosyltransferase